jgi:hypothetical protein
VPDHGQAHLLRSSPNLHPIRTARSSTRGYMELSHAFQILGVRAFPVRFRLRIHAGRPNHAYRLRDVVGTEASGEDDGGADRFDDASADAPVVRQAERADLLVRGAVAVKQKIVRNPVIASSDADAFFPVDWHAPHDQAARQHSFDCSHLIRIEQFRSCAKVDDRGPKRAPPFDDQVRSRSEKQRRKPRRRRYRSRNFRRLRERPLYRSPKRPALRPGWKSHRSGSAWGKSPIVPNATPNLGGLRAARAYSRLYFNGRSAPAPERACRFLVQAWPARPCRRVQARRRRLRSDGSRCLGRSRETLAITLAAVRVAAIIFAVLSLLCAVCAPAP